MLFPQRGAFTGDAALLHSCPSVIVSATALSSMLAVNNPSSSLVSSVNASNKLPSSFVPASLIEPVVSASSVIFQQGTYESQPSFCESTARTLGSCTDSQGTKAADKHGRNSRKECGILVVSSPTTLDTSAVCSEDKLAAFQMGERITETCGTATLTLRGRELSYCIDAVPENTLADMRHNQSDHLSPSASKHLQEAAAFRGALSAHEGRLCTPSGLCSSPSEKRSKSCLEREQSPCVQFEAIKGDSTLEFRKQEFKPGLQAKELDSKTHMRGLDRTMQASHSRASNLAVSDGTLNQQHDLSFVSGPLELPSYQQFSDLAVSRPVCGSYNNSLGIAFNSQSLTGRKVTTRTSNPPDTSGFACNFRGCQPTNVTSLCNQYACRSSRRCFHAGFQSSRHNNNCCLPVSARFRKAARSVRSYAHLLFSPLVCAKNPPSSAASAQRRCLVSQPRTLVDVKAGRRVQISRDSEEHVSKYKEVTHSVSASFNSATDSGGQATQWLVECQSSSLETSITAPRPENHQYLPTCFPIMAIPNYLRKRIRQDFEQKNTGVFLTEDDARSLTALCLVARWPYSKDDPNHESLLKEYWCAAFSDASYRPPPDNQWLRLGFQSGDPRTDFRGGGILSLMCMVYFARQHPEVGKSASVLW